VVSSAVLWHDMKAVLFVLEYYMIIKSVCSSSSRREILCHIYVSPTCQSVISVTYDLELHITYQFLEHFVVLTQW
jgi:hypothetical protein